MGNLVYLNFVAALLANRLTCLSRRSCLFSSSYDLVSSYELSLYYERSEFYALTIVGELGAASSIFDFDEECLGAKLSTLAEFSTTG